MIEKEYKYNLTTEDYQKIKNYLVEHEAKCFTNHNFYFTSDNDFSCRIREVSGKYELTFKKKTKDSLAHLEITLELKESDALNFIKQKELSLDHDYLAYLNSKGLEVTNNEFKLLGMLETKRMELVTNLFSICLDKSNYLGTTDLELELEQVNPDLDLKEEVNQFMNELDLNLEASKASKQKRFMDRLNDLDFLDFEERIELFKEARAIMISPGYNEALVEFNIVEVTDYGTDYIYCLLEHSTTHELIYFKTTRDEDAFEHFSICDESDFAFLKTKLN